MTTFISFARRRNSDTTIDSICTKCYQTIASAHTPGDLQAYEQVHRCDPSEEINYSHASPRPTEALRSIGSMGPATGFSGFLARLDSIQNDFRSKVANRQR